MAALLEARRRAGQRDAPMQLGDEGRIGFILTLLLDHAFPRARQDLQLGRALRPQLGHEAVRLHARRPIRQAQTAKIAKRNMARFAPGDPIDAVAGELEFPSRAQQRRPVGISEGLAGARAVNAHVDRLRGKVAHAPVSWMGTWVWTGPCSSIGFSRRLAST